MNILIVGAGVVGQSLAEQLSSEGHRVAVVDNNRAKIQAISDKLDVLAVLGNAGMPSVLGRAGIRNADMVIAVTDVDEVNLVVAMMAARLKVKHRIARIRNQEYLDDTRVLPLHELGIDHVINPEPTIVGALSRMIEIPGSSDFATLAGGQVLMLGFDIEEDSPVAGRSMAELRDLSVMDAFLILTISRKGQLIVPRGHHRIEPGDKIHLLVSADTIQFISPLIHRRQKQVQEVIIAGASRIGLQLAQAIQGKIPKVYLIEPDEQLAEEAADLLKNVTVLHGDETDLDVLEEVALDRCDLFCALTDNDQRNMLSSLLVQRHSKARTAVLVHQPEYVQVMDSLGAQIVVNPRLITVGEIMMHVRKGLIHSVTRLGEGRAEILELEVGARSLATREPLMQLKFPEDALVGAVVRNGVMQIPRGDTQIQAGDTVVVFALPEAIPRIEKLFAQRRR